ncbi:Transcription regulator AsnC-type, partial [Trema orientale]
LSQLPKEFLSFFLTHSTQPPPPIIMSSSPKVEHVILFKVKEDAEPSEVNNMVSLINGMSSLDEVLYLTAAPTLRVRSSIPSLAFTHVSHSRFKSEPDLSAYAVNPIHLDVKKRNGPLVADILAVDWFTGDLGGGVHVAVPPGSAVRVTFWKLKEGLGDKARSEILEGIKGIKEKLGGGVSQFTYGENFSDRAKGFSIAFLAVFPSQTELEAADPNQDENFKDYLDDTFGLDFVVPPPPQ